MVNTDNGQKENDNQKNCCVKRFVFPLMTFIRNNRMILQNH